VNSVGIKRTLIKKKLGRFGAKWSSRGLDLVYTDIYGPFITASWNGRRYFITFTDDYSRCGHRYLIHKKSQSLDMFKIYKTEVENQQNRNIKAVRSDRSDKYYNRYDGFCQFTTRVWYCSPLHHVKNISSKWCC